MFLFLITIAGLNQPVRKTISNVTISAYEVLSCKVLNSEKKTAVLKRQTKMKCYDYKEPCNPYVLKLKKTDNIFNNPKKLFYTTKN